VLFAASNSAVLASLSPEATAKNVLTVGATQDGLDAHLVKIQGRADEVLGDVFPLFDGMDGRSCAALVDAALLPNLLSFDFTGCPAEASLTPSTCYALANATAYIYVGGNAYSEDSPNYIPANSIDLALCCSCTPQMVVDGAAAAAGPAALPYILDAYLSTYASRFRAAFSSQGPTVDGRIKPDVAAPGEDVVSARGMAKAGLAFNSFTCPDTTRTVSNENALQGSWTLTGEGPEAGADAEVRLTITEPVTLSTVTLHFEGMSEDAYVWFAVYDEEENELVTSQVWMDTLSSDISQPFDLVVPLAAPHDLPPGSFYILIWVSEGVDFSFLGAYDANVRTLDFCFGTLSTNFRLSLDVERGSAASFIHRISGTSMATPTVTAAAALARQYFVDGYFPTGARTPANGFAPSAALLKGLLINSATALLDMDAAALLGFEPPSLPQVLAEGGHGVPNLARGLPLPSLGSATRASGALPVLLLPRQSPEPGAADPTITDGQVLTWCVDVGTRPASAKGTDMPLSATLVYTDPRGLPSALYALVNNLNLEMTLPSGRLLLGNNDPNATNQQRDTRNNVEKITVYGVAGAPTLGADLTRLRAPYAVTVRGSSIPFGPQAFALLLTGPALSLAPPGINCGGAPSPAPSPSARPSVSSAPSPSSPGAPAAAGGGSAAEVAALTAGVAVAAVAAALAVGVAVLCGVRAARLQGAAAAAAKAKAAALQGGGRQQIEIEFVNPTQQQSFARQHSMGAAHNMQ